MNFWTLRGAEPCGNEWDLVDSNAALLQSVRSFWSGLRGSVLDVRVARAAGEDETYAKSPQLRWHLRRGFAFHLDSQPKLLRRGLPKFFDYPIEDTWPELKDHWESQLEAIRQETPHFESRWSLIVHATEKLNGENAQISFEETSGLWVCGSKNVTLLTDDLGAHINEILTAEKTPRRYETAIRVAVAWLTLVSRLSEAEVEQLKNLLRCHTLIGELFSNVGNLGRVIQSNEQERDILHFKPARLVISDTAYNKAKGSIVFYALVNTRGDEDDGVPLYPAHSARLLLPRELNIVEFSTLQELSSSGRFDSDTMGLHIEYEREAAAHLEQILQGYSSRVFSARNTEGSVVYIGLYDADTNQYRLLNLFKVKSLEYKLRRRVREVSKGAVGLASTDEEILGSFDRYAKRLLEIQNVENHFESLIEEQRETLSRILSFLRSISKGPPGRRLQQNLRRFFDERFQEVLSACEAPRETRALDLLSYFRRQAEEEKRDRMIHYHLLSEGPLKPQLLEYLPGVEHTAHHLPSWGVRAREDSKQHSLTLNISPFTIEKALRKAHEGELPNWTKECFDSTRLQRLILILPPSSTNEDGIVCEEAIKLQKTRELEQHQARRLRAWREKIKELRRLVGSQIAYCSEQCCIWASPDTWSFEALRLSLQDIKNNLNELLFPTEGPVANSVMEQPNNDFAETSLDPEERRVLWVLTHGFPGCGKTSLLKGILRCLARTMCNENGELDVETADIYRSCRISIAPKPINGRGDESQVLYVQDFSELTAGGLIALRGFCRLTNRHLTVIWLSSDDTIERVLAQFGEVQGRSEVMYRRAAKRGRALMEDRARTQIEKSLELHPGPQDIWVLLDKTQLTDAWDGQLARIDQISNRLRSRGLWHVYRHLLFTPSSDVCSSYPVQSVWECESCRDLWENTAAHPQINSRLFDTGARCKGPSSPFLRSQAAQWPNSGQIRPIPSVAHAWSIPWSVDAVIECVLRVVRRKDHPTLDEAARSLPIYLSFLVRNRRVHWGVLARSAVSGPYGPYWQYSGLRGVQVVEVDTTRPSWDVLCRAISPEFNGLLTDAQTEVRKLLAPNYFQPFADTHIMKPLCRKLLQIVTGLAELIDKDKDLCHHLTTLSNANLLSNVSTGLQRILETAALPLGWTVAGGSLTAHSNLQTVSSEIEVNSSGLDNSLSDCEMPPRGKALTTVGSSDLGGLQHAKSGEKKFQAELVRLGAPLYLGVKLYSPEAARLGFDTISYFLAIIAECLRKTYGPNSLGAENAISVVMQCPRDPIKDLHVTTRYFGPQMRFDAGAMRLAERTAFAHGRVYKFAVTHILIVAEGLVTYAVKPLHEIGVSGSQLPWLFQKGRRKEYPHITVSCNRAVFQPKDSVQLLQGADSILAELGLPCVQVGKTQASQSSTTITPKSESAMRAHGVSRLQVPQLQTQVVRRAFWIPRIAPNFFNVAVLELDGSIVVSGGFQAFR